MLPWLDGYGSFPEDPKLKARTPGKKIEAALTPWP
jgi:hypothetical protein